MAPSLERQDALRADPTAQQLGARWRSRRLRAVLTSSLAGALTVLAVLRMQGMDRPPASAASAASAVRDTRPGATPHIAMGVASYGVAPKDAATDQALAEKMAHAIDLRGVRGVVRGKTGAPTSRTLPGDPPLGSVVTDYPFAVAAFSGKEPKPYAAGRTIALRVPGGTSGKLTTAVEGAPSVSQGQDLFVFVRDQGAIGGGNTSTVLVASDGTDVLEVRNGTVYGQGGWSGYSAPVATFPLLFQR